MKRPLTSAQVSEAVEAGTGVQNTLLKNTLDKPRPLMHYVKILGKPSLPKRKAMEAFFSEFKPKSIKKHKNVHNLLFVGFIDKESYDNILAADGTTIGRFTLDIKVSERNDPNKNRIIAKPEVKSEAENSNNSDIIGADIDNQITDLLTSINNAESEIFSDDIVMAEPPVVNQTDVKENEKVDQTDVQENEEEVKIAEEEDSNADQNANNVTSDDVQITEAPQNDVIEIHDEPEHDDVVEVKDVQNYESSQETEKEEAERTDVVEELQAEVKGTPTRASARLASSAGGIRTRRMSKLAE